MPLRTKLLQHSVHFSIICSSCAEVIHICAMFLSTIFFIMRLFKTEHWKENGCWYSKCYDIKTGLWAKHTPEMENMIRGKWMMQRFSYNKPVKQTSLKDPKYLPNLHYLELLRPRAPLKYYYGTSFLESLSI